MDSMSDQASVDLATAALVGLQGLMLRAIKEREGDNAAVAYLDRIQSGAAAFNWTVCLTSKGAEIEMGYHSHDSTAWMVRVSLKHADPSPPAPRRNH